MKRCEMVFRLFICTMLVFSLSFSVNATNYQKAGNSSSVETCLVDEKIYSNVTLEQDFVDNHVIVVLDHSISGINKEIDLSMFSDVNPTCIKDLMRLEISESETDEENNLTCMSSVDNNNCSMFNSENFRQILLLELPAHSKYGVINAIRKLEQIEGVMYAGPDYITYSDAIITDDTYFDEQWAIEQVQLGSAWDIETGSSTVRVGVIDSGVATHPDLNTNVTQGYDFYYGNSTTADDAYGHGTHVAGIIGAIGNNEEGTSGVSWNITIVPLQVANSSGASTTEYSIDAIKYAMNNNIPIINYSRSSSDRDDGLAAAIANYHGLFVCSASNQGNNIDNTPRYPASFKLPNMIVVSASGANDAIPDWSNIGNQTVHLFAPGASIISCFPSDICTSGCNPELHGVHVANGYHRMNGTSMATPYVTGVAALIKSLRPNLSAVEIKALILDNVDKVETLSEACITGGRLNAYKAVRAATEAETFVDDVNNDGYSDVIMSRNKNGKRAITVFLGKADGSFKSSRTSLSDRNFFYDDPAFIGDFDGDGYTDVLIHWVNGSNRQLLLYRGKGTGFFYEAVNLSSTRNHDPNGRPCQFFVDDVNGDGKDDFIVHFRDGSGNRSALVYKGISTSPYISDAPTNALTSTNQYRANDPVFVGDFNGDGNADMLVHWTTSSTMRQLLIYKGNNDGTFSAGTNMASTIMHMPYDYPTKFYVTDMNGDDKDDFVVHWKNSSGKRCNLVYKGKSYSPYISNAEANALVSTVDYVEADPVFVGDMNGDGYSDMIVHWTNSVNRRQLRVYLANSNATYSEGVNLSTSDIHDPSIYAERFYVADVNGDGKKDFIVKYRNESTGEVNFKTYVGSVTGNMMPAVTSVLTGVQFFDCEL